MIYEEKVVECDRTDIQGRKFYNVAEQKEMVPVALNMDSLQEAFRLAVRIGLRQTCVEMPKKNMSEVQLEERLLGVSSTGWRDVYDALGWDTNGEHGKYVLQMCREWANDEATKYAKELGVPRPLLVTTIKPEGTASQVFGCSSGLHWDWSPYYIRRVRMSASDPLAKTLIQQGFKAFPELYDLQNWHPGYSQSSMLHAKTESMNKDTRNLLQKVYDKLRGNSIEYYSYTDVWKGLDNWERIKYFDKLPSHLKREIMSECSTVVFEFPVKSLAKVSQRDVSAIEQLENMKNFTQYYTDHMPSSTITVKDDEWDSVIEWVSTNWEDFTTASFLPYYGGDYPLLPYEEITEMEYLRKVKAVPEQYKTILESGRTIFKVDKELLQEYEVLLEDPDDIDLGSGCSTGCPIR